jgi:lipoate-protein ligase B
MRNLEESLIRMLEGYDIKGMRDPKFTGVWTNHGKIAAMGVHISRWITRHGFALNAATDLSFYDLIVPCGIVGKNVTSMQKMLSFSPDLRDIADRYIEEFGVVFHRNMRRMSMPELREELRLPLANPAVEFAFPGTSVPGS